MHFYSSIKTTSFYFFNASILNFLLSRSDFVEPDYQCLSNILHVIFYMIWPMVLENL